MPRNGDGVRNQRVIAGSPALQERATAKTRSLIAALASALGERGLSAPQANLAAHMGMAYSATEWRHGSTMLRLIWETMSPKPSRRRAISPPRLRQRQSGNRRPQSLSKKAEPVDLTSDHDKRKWRPEPRTSSYSRGSRKGLMASTTPD